MRKIIAALQTSVDGFIEGPNGELDWAMAEDEETWRDLDETLSFLHRHAVAVAQQLLVEFASGVARSRGRSGGLLGRGIAACLAAMAVTATAVHRRISRPVLVIGYDGDGDHLGPLNRGVQRRLGIGYNRAASLIERMEKEGLIGAANHAGKREILVGGDDADCEREREPLLRQPVRHTQRAHCRVRM